MNNKPRMRAPQHPKIKPMKYYWDHNRGCYYPYYHDYSDYYPYDSDPYDHEWNYHYLGAPLPPPPPPQGPGGGGGYPPPPIIPKPAPRSMKASNIDGIDDGWYNYSSDDIQISYQKGFQDGWMACMMYCSSSDNGYDGSAPQINGYSCSMGYTGSQC